MCAMIRYHGVKTCLESAIVGEGLGDDELVTVYDHHFSLSQALSAKRQATALERIADLLEVANAEDGKIITLPQILLRIALALEPTNQSGMNSITESLHGIMLNGRG